MGRLISIIKADKKPHREEQANAGYAALAPFADGIQERYENSEIDKWDFFYELLSMNNTNLSLLLSRRMDDAPDEDTPALGDDLLVNRPVIMHLKRLQNEYPELKQCQEEHEAVEGNETLNQMQGATRGVRDDISAFIAQPFLDGREKGQYYENELKGIQNLLLSDGRGLTHPLGLALGKAVELSQDNILPTPRQERQLSAEEIAEMADRKRRRRGEIADPSFQSDQDKAATRQQEMLDTMFRNPEEKVDTVEREKELGEDYARFFEQTDMGRRGGEDAPSISLRKPSSNMVNQLVRLIRSNALSVVDTEDSVDEANRQDAIVASFGDVQQKFNNFMSDLTGNPFGTAGRAGRFGGEITAVKSKNALTPSLREAAKQLGIALPVATVPDLLLRPFVAGKNAFSREVVESLTEQLGQLEDTSNFHPQLMNAIRSGGELDANKDDPQEAIPDASISGSQEEREGKGAEARMGVGQTEEGLRDPELGERLDDDADQKYQRQLAKLERMKSSGFMTEEDYQMQLLAAQLNRANKNDADDKHRIDDFAELGGLSGNDFEVGHPLHGASTSSILRATSDFASNLVGMGRVLSDLRFSAYYHQDAQLRSEMGDVDKQLAEINLTAEDILHFSNPRTLQDSNRYKKLDELLGGKSQMLMERMSSQMNRRMSRMHALFPHDDPAWRTKLLNAAMRYTNADMSVDGYKDAFKYLGRQFTQKGSLKGYEITRLLRYLERTGEREAMDEEHQQKVIHQQKRWQNHHNALQSAGEDDEVSEEHKHHLIGEDEECVACHPDRFGNRTADEAYAHSPKRRDKTPYKYKMMTMPLLEEYQQGGRTAKLKVLGDEGERTSLQKILQYIYPDDDQFNKSKLESFQASAAKKGQKMAWEKRNARRYRALIKNAVASGNPRAHNIYKQFGLYKTAENTIAGGSAGMSGKQLAALSFFLNDDDAYDAHHEKARVRTLVATRMDALDTALTMIDAIAEGELGKTYKPGALGDEATRQSIAQEIYKDPQNAMKLTRKKLANAEKERELISQNKTWRTYAKDIGELKRAEEGLKQRTERDETGIERKYPGPYDNPQGRARIEQMKNDFKAQYGTLERQLKNVNNRIDKGKEKLKSQSATSRENLSRTNEYALGAFIKAGPLLLKVHGMKNRQDQLEGLTAIMDDLYGDTEDIIFAAQSNGNVYENKSHTIDEYKDSRMPMGKLGEMGGTNIREFTNNLAAPIVDDINMLKAHRAKMGFPLTKEQAERAKGLIHDGEMAEHIDKELNDSLAHLVPEGEIINHADVPQDHHNEEPNEAGQLSEAEMRKRHHNSHFTRGAESAILRNDYEFMPIEKLHSNWRQHAPTLCGTCHGTGHVSRDEAATYLRNHIPELKGEVKNSAAINKYMASHCRPRDTPSYDDHIHADTMHVNDHEQLACPDCDHEDPDVIGGRVSNGLCSHCHGHGKRCVDDDEHLQEGYTDADGNTVKGKNHHYDSMTSQGFDLLNRMFGQVFDARLRNDMPDFLRDMMPRIPLPSQVYADALESGKYISRAQLMRARKKQHIPLSMDDYVPEITGGPERNYEKEEEEGRARAAERAKELAANPKPEPTKEAGEETPAKQALAQLNFQSTHNAFMDSHHKTALRERVIILGKIIESFVAKSGNSMTQNEKDAFIEEAQDYLNRLLQPDSHTLHNDDMHSLNNDLQELQEMAEMHFTVDPDEKGRMPQTPTLPVDEKGAFNLGVNDVFSGELPMKFQHYPPLHFYHGRFLTPTEISEGLFDPSRTNAQPRDIRLEDMEDFFANNKEARRLIKMKQREHDLSDEKLKPIVDSIGGLKNLPMVMKKATGLEHADLIEVSNRAGMPLENYDMVEEGLSFSDELTKAFKENGAKDVGNMLSTIQNGRRRSIGGDYTSKLNKQIRAMYLQYAKLKGLEIFLADHANPLDHPFIPEGLTIEQFGQQKEQFNPELFYDEVAKLYGYADEESMDKGKGKMGLIKKHHIPRGNRGDFVLDPKAFKAEVMRNITENVGDQLGFSHAQYGKDGNGNPTTTIEPVEVDKMLDKGEAMSELDGSKFDTMLDMMRYHLRPNWSMQEDLTKLMQGQEGIDGFDNYEELQRAYKEGALPDDVMKKLTNMKTMSAFAHPTLRPHNYDTMAQYDYANKQVNGSQQPMDFDERQEIARQRFDAMADRTRPAQPDPNMPPVMQNPTTEYRQRQVAGQELREGMAAFPPYQPQAHVEQGQQQQDSQ